MLITKERDSEFNMHLLKGLATVEWNSTLQNMVGDVLYAHSHVCAVTTVKLQCL